MSLGVSVVCGASPKVAILLCTFNGESFLDQQLLSIVEQTHDNWEVWASDDGSTDGTVAILEDWRRRLPPGRLHIVEGPRQGFVRNFLSLASFAEIEADYFAFCDQDDIWEAGKLERALSWVGSESPGTPVLYCSRTRLIDEKGAEVGLSPLFVRPPSFGNALVQNIGGGNTMMFNMAARKLLLTAGPKANPVAHDWWTYILVSGCGGRVFYDPKPEVRYRQHDKNLIGNSARWATSFRRVRMILSGRLRDWNQRNLDALKAADYPLSSESVALMQRFERLREGPSFVAVVRLFKHGIYRQTLLDNLGLALAAMFRKL